MITLVGRSVGLSRWEQTILTFLPITLYESPLPKIACLTAFKISLPFAKCYPFTKLVQCKRRLCNKQEFQIWDSKSTCVKVDANCSAMVAVFGRLSERPAINWEMLSSSSIAAKCAASRVLGFENVSKAFPNNSSSFAKYGDFGFDDGSPTRFILFLASSS